ncbi:hypothetical protein E2C01_019892 [Portunus trituberculatus]|uniref:Uncharacterized protein n=1 Tax=Portunus trituberculatus TaxID=210409 RepID=A0A5B7DZV4_PORTR|nr:hypothetical protein [Portunus trituberculatus]
MIVEQYGEQFAQSREYGGSVKGSGRGRDGTSSIHSPDPGQLPATKSELNLYTRGTHHLRIKQLTCNGQALAPTVQQYSAHSICWCPAAAHTACPSHPLYNTINRATGKQAYQKVFPILKLGLDFCANITFWNFNVITQITRLHHEGQETIIRNVNQL